VVTDIQNMFTVGSWPVAFLSVAVIGAVASFSSCTIARLPVVWGYITATSMSRRKGFLLSLAFACGLIISYTCAGFLFGLIAGSAAKFLRASGFIYFSFGILLFIGGLFFAGLIPAGKGRFNERCESGMKHAKTVLSAFLFGILYALLEIPACPCCGAVLMVIASLAVIKGSVIYSGLVFLSFAVGQSMPIVVIGFSASILKHLTRRAHAMESAIGYIAGNILIVAGLFMMIIS